MHKPVIKGNYTVTGDTIVIRIVEHKDDKIQWEYNMYISIDTGEPETLKESMTGPNGHLLKFPAISEVKIIFQERHGF